MANKRKVAGRKSAPPAPLLPRKPHARARVSNTGALIGVDGRSAAARRYHDIASAIVADQGGVERMSEARVQLIRRLAAVSVLAELLEARFARGETIDIAEHSQLASTATRLVSRIGIDRRARNITPSLNEYLAGQATGGDDD